MSEYVNTHSDGYSRTIELNRPAALNSLNYDMVRAITEAIKVKACSLCVYPIAINRRGRGRRAAM